MKYFRQIDTNKIEFKCTRFEKIFIIKNVEHRHFLMHESSIHD